LTLGVEFAMSYLRFSKAAADEIALMLAAGVASLAIATNFHCHFTTVYWIKQKVEMFEEAQPAPASLISRPRKTRLEAIEGLLDWLLDNSDDKKLSYLDEMVWFLYEEHDKGVLSHKIFF
jgi:hypothetical protein